MIAYFKKSWDMAWILGSISCVLGFSVTFLLLGGSSSKYSSGFLHFGGSFLVSFIALYIVIYFARLREYQDCLSKLYVDLDPEAFIKKIRPLLEIKTDIVLHTTTKVHLANGYMAMGDFKTALDILNKIELPERALELRGLILSNQISCYLQQGDGKRAEEKIEEVKKLLRDKRCKKEFIKKARHALGYQTICLQILKGKDVSAEALEKDFETSRNPLHRVSVMLQLARVYLKHNEEGKFEEAQNYVIEQGKFLYFSKLAASMG